MESSSIRLGTTYVAYLPVGDRENMERVVPLEYLGLSRWRVQRIDAGRVAYVSSSKIIGRAGAAGEGDDPPATTSAERTESPGHCR